MSSWPTVSFRGSSSCIRSRTRCVSTTSPSLRPHRGRGYGRILLDFAERTAAAAGFSSVRLYTNEAMTENVALYARLGYVESHRGVANGFRRIYMHKALV